MKFLLLTRAITDRLVVESDSFEGVNSLLSNTSFLDVTTESGIRALINTKSIDAVIELKEQKVPASEAVVEAQAETVEAQPETTDSVTTESSQAI